MNDHNFIERRIERWLKWVAVAGPLLSGLVFGTLGFVGGYQQAKQDIVLANARLNLLENWKDKQESFNQTTVAAIARLKALVRDIQP